MEGIETRRFGTGNVREPYDAVISKMRRGKPLSNQDEQDFFNYGINSPDLVRTLVDYVNDEYELIALPYFHGLTHSVINDYPRQISLVPCFHDEPQCATVCPVDCCVDDEDVRETKEELLAKKTWLHLE